MLVMIAGRRVVYGPLRLIWSAFSRLGSTVMRCGWSGDAVADAAVGLAEAVRLRVACSFGARGRRGACAPALSGNRTPIAAASPWRWSDDLDERSNREGIITLASAMISLVAIVVNFRVDPACRLVGV